MIVFVNIRHISPQPPTVALKIQDQASVAPLYGNPHARIRSVLTFYIPHEIALIADLLIIIYVDL